MSDVRTLRRGEAVGLETLSGSDVPPGDVRIAVHADGEPPDVVALLLGADGRVRDDRDLVFFNAPVSVDGAVRIDPARAVAAVRTGALEAEVARVLVAVAGGALERGLASRVRVDVARPDGAPLATAVVDLPAGHRAESLLEVYRRAGGWRVRLLGEGYDGGLAALVRDHGVTVDDTPAPVVATAPIVVPPPVAAPVPVPVRTPVATPVPGPTRPTRVSTRSTPAQSCRPRRRRPLVLAGGAAALVVLGVGAGAALSGGATEPAPVAVAETSSTVPSPSVVTPSPVPVVLPAAAGAVVPAAAAAQADLALLPVKGRAPMTGYDRAQFGQAWADVDRNGCDTRNDVLRRDVSNAVIYPSSHGCVVLSGTVSDPYSGTTIPFTRGPDTSAHLQVDHVVALGDAWQTGAQQLDATRREQFANDPANLLVVDGALNAQKGDGDAATWLPPNVAFRCTYVAQQVAVKKAYGLWVTAAERDAIAGVLGGCPGATTPPAPTTSAPPTTAAPVPSAPSVAVVSTPVAPPPATPAPSDVYYPNCAAARAAGAAPILRGQPGYRPGLDRDDDGIACE